VVQQIRAQIEAPGVSFQDRPYLPQDRRAPGWQRNELDPLLDADGNLLPQLLQPRVPRPPALPANSDWQDGSELQYLKRFEPFPYGVSPFALAYNYYKRSQVLMEVNKQKHAQLSDLVIDSRPALALKNWSEEEWERGRRAELEAFALRIPSERLDMDLPAASLKLDAPVPRRAPLDEAIYSYRRSAELVLDAIVEYERHLANDKTNLSTYESHMDGLRAQRALTLGDHHYLRAMDALNPTAQQRAEQIRLARQNYQDAIRLNQLLVLRYYITEDIAQRLFPSGVTRANIIQKNLSSEQIEQIWNGVAAIVASSPQTFQHGD